MIPLKDENPTRRFPIVTILLIVANIGIYFLVQQGPIEFLAQDPQEQIEDIRFNFENAAIPCEVVEGRPLTEDEIDRTLRFGDAEACQDEPAGREVFSDKNVWWSVIVSMFLHGGLIHLGGNMLFLWIFGNNIEDHLGVVRFVLFYLIGGLVAAAAHIAIQPDSTVPVVGASGAIAGVMGAYLVWFPNAPIKTVIIFYFIFFRDIAAKWLLGFWFVSQFFDVVNPNSGVAWMAHVGGFVFGVLVGLAVRGSRGARDALWRDDYALERGGWDDTGGFRASDRWRGGPDDRGWRR